MNICVELHNQGNANSGRQDSDHSFLQNKLVIGTQKYFPREHLGHLNRKVFGEQNRILKGLHFILSYASLSTQFQHLNPADTIQHNLQHK